MAETKEMPNNIPMRYDISEDMMVPVTQNWANTAVSRLIELKGRVHALEQENEVLKARVHNWRLWAMRRNIGPIPALSDDPTGDALRAWSGNGAVQGEERAMMDTSTRKHNTAHFDETIRQVTEQGDQLSGLQALIAGLHAEVDTAVSRGSNVNPALSAEINEIFFHYGNRVQDVAVALSSAPGSHRSGLGTPAGGGATTADGSHPAGYRPTPSPVRNGNASSSGFTSDVVPNPDGKAKAATPEQSRCDQGSPLTEGPQAG